MEMAIRKHDPMRNNRGGFTLIELLSVIAILAFAAAVIAPMASNWWMSQRLQGAIDDLRTDWIHARTAAMDEGRVYRFQILDNQQAYRIAPNEMDYWPEQANGVNAPPTGDPEENPGVIIEKSLPNNLHFEPANDMVNISGGNLDSTWLFLPDGRAKLLDATGREHQQASIIITEHTGRRRQLTMRALTAQAQQIPLQQPQP